MVAVACIFELIPLRPILVQYSLGEGQTRRVYFEPVGDDVEIRLDGQRGGYMTEVESDRDGNLVVPAGRTIAIALTEGDAISVETMTADLAPHLLFGEEVPLGDQPASGQLNQPRTLTIDDGQLRVASWDPWRPWDADRAQLQQLHQACAQEPRQHAVVLRDGGTIRVRYGRCQTEARVVASPDSIPSLVIAAGASPATAERPGGWQRSARVGWGLIAMAAVHLAIFAYSLGIEPTLLALGALALIAQRLPAEAMLAWFATLAPALPALVARLCRDARGARPAASVAAAVIVFAAQLGLGAMAVSRFDAGTFGHERITHAGDESCSIVGYSTVRGDSLREGSAGLVDFLNADCGTCRQRTSRFSREAQTLRWVRQTVCDPTLPTPAGGDIVFFGGGNDDAFYQPTKVLQVVAGLVGMMRFFADPLSAAAWERAFDAANERAQLTLVDQSNDITAITRCAREGGRRFWFLHDFLVWDLDRGRSPARQRNFESRRGAAKAAGAEFIDVLEEVRSRAGLAWMNDFIHPSAVAQREIATLLCQRLTAVRGGGATQDGGKSRP